jgi:hypothetical protein
MNRKLYLLAMLVCLLALSLVFGSCDNGTNGGGGGIGGPDLRATLLGTFWGKQNGSYHVTIEFSDSIEGHEYGFRLIDGNTTITGDYFYNGTLLDIGGGIVTAILAGSVPDRTLTISGFRNDANGKWSVYNGTWAEEDPTP